MKKNSMRELPTSEIYEQEFAYFPWGKLTDKIISLIIEEAPHKGRVMDLACGPGYLLGKIAEQRSDLSLSGIDIDREYIKYAQDKYSGINFIAEDVLMWQSADKYDIVLSTAGLHHIAYDKQSEFIKKIADAVVKTGFSVIADPYINDYSNENERKVAAAELGQEYLIATIQNGAPEEIIQAALDIQFNDVMGYEFKTSLKKIIPIFYNHFTEVKVDKIWPKKESEYGDYVITARKKDDSTN